MTHRLSKLNLDCLEDRTVPALILQLGAGGGLTGIFGVPAGDVDLVFLSDNVVNVQEDGNDLGTYDVPGNLSMNLGNVVAAVAVNVDFAGSNLSGSLAITVGNAVSGYAISLFDGSVSGNLTIRAGSGPDAIALDTIAVGGSAAFDAGAGPDLISLVNSAVAGRVNVANADVVTDAFATESNFTYTQSEGTATAITLDALSIIEGSVFVTTRNGNDSVTINATVLGNATLRLGNGQNVVNGFVGDAFQLSGSLSITTGNGADEIFLDGIIGERATIMTGAGSDLVDLGTDGGLDLYGSTITINLGAGDDSSAWDVVNAPGARLNLQLGAGADVVDWSNAIPALASALIDGGSGADVFDASSGTIAFPIILRSIA